MIHIATRVRELVSSNIDSLVSKAGSQHKMLRLLQSEIEEALIGLHGDAAKAKRAHERQVEATSRLAAVAEEWTGKAKTAVDHGREDLARAALLARESDRKKVEELEAEVDALSGQVAELEEAITELEAKRENVGERIADLPAKANGSGDTKTQGDSPTDRKLDRIDELDRRTNYAGERGEDVAPADVDAEIAALSQASAIDAELEAMKKPTAKRARKKAK